MIVIYELTCTKNNKSYIGKNDSEKSDEHYPAGRFWDESENQELVDDAYRYGSKFFEVKLLLETDTLDAHTMNELKDFLIIKRKTLSPDGYNKNTFTDPKTKTDFDQ